MGNIARGGYSNLSFEQRIKYLEAENTQLKAEVQRLLYIGEKIPIQVENCENYAGFGNTWYREEGLYIHIHVGVAGLTTNTATVIATMPKPIRPRENVVIMGFASNKTNVSKISVQANGKIYVTSSELHATGDLYYLKQEE